MRKIYFIFTLLSTLFIAGLSLFSPKFLWFYLFTGPLILLGAYDMIQSRHSIARNFPIVGRLRFFMEDLRPKIYQYFVESDTSGTPFNRLSRSVIYQRAKNVDDSVPFGTQLDVYQSGYEWLNHSISAYSPLEINHNPRVMVGGPDCSQPYSASVYNISAMSFGSLSENAILALNGGAAMGKFAHNTGEGGLSDHHLRPGGDLIWQIGTGYFSCRNKDGSFNDQAFTERAHLPQVKMIEIKMSQGAKPGHGGILPARKVTEEIARIRLVEMGQDVISPPTHSAFSNPLEMVAFIKKLRELSGGKPIGFKLCIGNKCEFIAICKAMYSTGIYADFITVDGGEGGTGAAPQEFSNAVGMPLRDALAFVHDILTGFDLRKHIRVIASGKIISGFDMVKCFAIGADMCNVARGMMFALGCIQALECNKNTCPTGIATQDPSLTVGLDVTDKKVRVFNFHRSTVNSAVHLIAAAGLKHPSEIHRALIYRRTGPNSIKTYAEMYPPVQTGSLTKLPYPPQYENEMNISSEDTFRPQYEKIMNLASLGSV